MKIIVAHPGKQHSFRLATALEKAGVLQLYVTTLYKKSDSLLFKILNLFLSNDNKKRADGRQCKDIPESRIESYCSFLGLLELVLLRLDKSTNLYRKLHSVTVDRFGKKVAKLAIKEKADVVVCYDSNAITTFKYLKEHAPQIVKVLDVSIASRHYMKNIFETEVNASGNEDLRVENLYLWEKGKIEKLVREFRDSDYFLAASDFVKDSILDLGISADRVLKVPYGANVESSIERQILPEDSPINFMFAGQVIYRKGITYVFEAANQLNHSKAHLDVVGLYNPDSWFIKHYQGIDNIKIHGGVTFDRMKSLYEQANVFVLPSFAEGMAQVGIEAMACGLPIICTYNSGLSDLVEDGVNGFVVKEGDLEDLKNKMQWFIDNPSAIKTMGEAARNKAKAYSWDSYDNNVVNALLSLK